MQQPWNPEPHPFGNARGLDNVSTDVYARIAHRFGATVHAGHLPADLAVEQRDLEQKPPSGEPFAVFTISHDGLTLSGDHPNGRSHTTGYRSHAWLDRIGPTTIVVDLRSVPDDQIVGFAVRGPMLDPSLPPGTLDTFAREVLDAPFAQAIARSYLGSIRATLAACGYDVPEPPEPPRLAVTVIDGEGVHSGTLTSDERGDLVELHPAGGDAA